MEQDPTLSLDTLGNLDDGIVRLVVNRAIQEALNDCDARPALDASRKVTIAVSLKPTMDEGARGLKGVHVDVQTRTAIPPRKGNSEYLRTSALGDDVQAYLPDAHQDTLFGATGRDPDAS